MKGAPKKSSVPRLGSAGRNIFDGINTQSLSSVITGLGRGGAQEAELWYGRTYLTQACSIGTAEIVGALIDGGCDINQQDAQGDWPLLMAVSAGEVEIVKLLLGRGAHIHPQGRETQILSQIDEKGEVFISLFQPFFSEQQAQQINIHTPATGSAPARKRL